MRSNTLGRCLPVFNVHAWRIRKVHRPFGVCRCGNLTSKLSTEVCGQSESQASFFSFYSLSLRQRVDFPPQQPKSIHASAETSQSSRTTDRDILEETGGLREDAEHFGLDVRIVAARCEMNPEKKTATEANDIMLVRGSVSLV